MIIELIQLNLKWNCQLELSLAINNCTVASLLAQAGPWSSSRWGWSWLVMAGHVWSWLVMFVSVNSGIGVRWLVLDRKGTFKSGYTSSHGTIASSSTQGYDRHGMIIQHYDRRVEELNTAAAFLSRSTLCSGALPWPARGMEWGLSSEARSSP